MGALTPGWSSRFSGLWLCLQREQPRSAFRNACLTNILLTFADSLLHCLFFLVPWMCWFLSLLLGLCPRHYIISVFVFGFCVSGRYLHLDTNVNIIHPQVNNSNEIQGSEDPWCGKEGRDTALGPGYLQHHCLAFHTTICIQSCCLFKPCSSKLFWTMNLNSESQNIVSWNGPTRVIKSHSSVNCLQAASCFHLQKTNTGSLCLFLVGAIHRLG